MTACRPTRQEERMKKAAIWSAIAALALVPGAASAQDKTDISFILNWIAGGDHAPYYYALQEGWYDEAGIDLNIEQGKGSALAVQRTGLGASQIGLADLGTALIAKGKGADFTAVMNVYANSPYGMYWLKSSGIEGIEDFAGKRIGNPPSDASTVKPVRASGGSISTATAATNSSLDPDAADR